MLEYKERPCVMCGRHFKPRRIDGTTCISCQEARKCRKGALAGKREPCPCPICGREFTPRSSKEKKCEDCREKGRILHEGKEWKRCTKCGHLFETGIGRTICTACSHKALEEQRKERHCLRCGKAFEPVRWNEKLCPSCRPYNTSFGDRRCHDCGRRTTNYRCPACTVKWRAKNGLTLSSGEEMA